MDLIVGKKELEAALKAVKPSVATGQYSLPALKGVRLHAWIDGGGHAGTLHLTGTDLELAIIRRAPATVTAPGKCVLPFKPLLQAVSAMQGETIQIVLEKAEEGDADAARRGVPGKGYTAGQAKIISGARTVTMRTLPLEDFPDVTTDPTAISEWFVTDAAVLAQTLQAVSIAASTDEARPVLTGIFMEVGDDNNLTAVCTDSYRLAYRKTVATGPAQHDAKIIPSRVGKIFAAQQGKRKEPSVVVARCGQSQASFEVEETCYVTRLIDGEFPNWRQLIPSDTPVTVEFPSDALASAIKGVSAFGGPIVTLHVNDTQAATIEAGSQDLGECKEVLSGVTVEGAGAGIRFAFNPDYLLDALKFVGEETVHMHGRDALRPFLWANGDVAKSAYLLMPVRI